MANKKISDLSKIKGITEGDLMLLVQEGVSVNCDIKELSDYLINNFSRQVFEACRKEFLSKQGRAEDSAKLGGVDASRYALKSNTTETGGASLEWAIPKMWLAEVPTDFDIYSDVPGLQGYMFCFGQKLHRELYPELFGVIGLSYTRDANGDIADDGKTFNLPDFRGRAPFGSAFGLATGFSTNVGVTGGNATTKLKAEQIPPHWHGLQGGGEEKVLAADSGLAYGFTALEGLTKGTYKAGQTTIDGVSTEIKPGKNEAIEILPPYLVANYIIKLKP